MAHLVDQVSAPQLGSAGIEKSSEEANPHLKRAKLAGKIALGVLAAPLLVAMGVVSALVALPVHLHFLWQRSKINEEIEKRRMAKLQEALTCGLKENAKWKLGHPSNASSMTCRSLLKEMPHALPEAEYFFIRQVLKIRDRVAKREGRVDELYADLQKLLKNKRFLGVLRALKGKDNSAVNFLTILATKFRSSNIDDILVNHAKQELRSNDFSFNQTAEALKGHREKITFKRDTPLQQVVWGITHPLAALHSSHSQLHPQSYNSHYSNPTYVVHEFDLDGIPVRYVAGPTPFNDPVYRELFLNEGGELRINLMDANEKSELPMIERMGKVADGSKNRDGSKQLEHVVLGFEIKQRYFEAKTVDALLSAYKEAILQRNKKEVGVSFSEDLLSDDEIEQVFDQTDGLVKELRHGPLDNHLKHAILVIADTMMSVKMMIKYLDSLKEKKSHDSDIDPDMRAAYISVACKQCFDRGPVYLAALMLFFRSLEKENPLSEEEFYRLAGLPLIRAPLNEDRGQQQKKLKVYEEVADLISGNLKILSQYTRPLKLNPLAASAGRRAHPELNRHS